MTSLIIEVLVISALLYMLTLTFAICVVEVLVVWASLIVIAFAATTLFIEVLTRIALVWLADTSTRLRVVVVRMITCTWFFALAITCLIAEYLVIPALLYIIA